jgi:hypothetical protein
MKKLVIALVLGGMVFSAAYAAAATLNLSTDMLGAGDEVVEACATGVHANYTTVLNTAVVDENIGPRYDLDDVVLTGLTEGCNNSYYKIAVLDASGAKLAEHGDGSTLVITGAPADFHVDFAVDEVPAENIDHIAVVITGPADAAP